MLKELGVRAVATVVMRYIRATHPRMTRSEIMELTKDDVESEQEELGPDLFEEVREEGRLEGSAKVLLALARRRFGSLTPEVEEQISRADEARLEVLTLRVLDAATLEEFLREP